MNYKVPYRSVRTVSCGDAVRFQHSCKCLAESFHILWHDNHTFVFASCVLCFLCFVFQRFLHDVLFDRIDGPGRVAILTERFSNVFFFLLSVTLLCMNREAGSYQLSLTWDQVISRSRASSSCKQSKRDQDVRRTSKRCH